MSTTDQIIEERRPASEMAMPDSARQAFYRSVAAACEALKPIDGSGFSTWQSTSHQLEAESLHEADRQIRRLVNFKKRKQGWDGRGAEAPNSGSLSAAIKFLQNLKSLPFPIPMASVGSDGNATLYWQSENFYADVEMYDDGTVGYLLQVTGKPSEDNEVLMPNFGIPSSIFQALIVSNPSKNR